MMEDVLQWFDGLAPAWSYLVLLGSSLVEYVFPPFPGDTIIFAGALLCGTASYPWWAVWGALTLGAILGGAMAWAFGRTLRAKQEKWPAVLRTEAATRRLATLEARFAKHGPAYLTVNRFVPAFRSLFFVAAGLSGLRLRAVVLYGGISAALWNGAIMALAFSLGRNVERLEALWAQYQRVGMVVVGVALLVGLLILWRRRAAKGRAAVD